MLGVGQGPSANRKTMQAREGEAVGRGAVSPPPKRTCQVKNWAEFAGFEESLKSISFGSKIGKV